MEYYQKDFQKGGINFRQSSQKGFSIKPVEIFKRNSR